MSQDALKNIIQLLPKAEDPNNVLLLAVEDEELKSVNTRAFASRTDLMNRPRWGVPQRDWVAESAWLSVDTSGFTAGIVTSSWLPELGLFMGTDYSVFTDSVWVSPDGVTWTERSGVLPVSSYYPGVFPRSSDGTLITLHQFPAGVAYSTDDGFTWSAATIPGITGDADMGNFFSIWVEELGLFVATIEDYSGTGDGHVITSADGITWVVAETFTGQPCGAPVWSPSLGVLVIAVYAGPATQRVYTSTDAVFFVPGTTPSGATPYSGVWFERLGLFVLTNGSAGFITSPDGETWTAASGPAAQNWENLSKSEDLGLLVAVTDSGTDPRICYSYDAVTWVHADGPNDVAIFGLSYSPELGLFVASSYNNGAASIYTSVSAWTYPYRS